MDSPWPGLAISAAACEGCAEPLLQERSGSTEEGRLRSNLTAGGAGRRSPYTGSTG